MAGSAAMKWQAVARPTAPPQTCSATRRLLACASVAMRLASMGPPVAGIGEHDVGQRPHDQGAESRIV
jgi:hypothetical protein